MQHKKAPQSEAFKMINLKIMLLVQLLVCVLNRRQRTLQPNHNQAI